MIITTYACDRCKKETKTLKNIYENGHSSLGFCYHKDLAGLCPECWEKFKIFLSGVV